MSFLIKSVRAALSLCSAGCATMLAIGPASAATVHIHSGDTLWKLARSYKVSVSAIQKANPHVSPRNLRIGSSIQIPVSSRKSKSGSPIVLHKAAVATTMRRELSSVSAQNLYWLSHLIHAEADGQPLRAQIAVGDVVVNRMNAGGYGSTVKAVIFQTIAGHAQFTSVANGWIYTQPDATNAKAARAVLNQQTNVVPSALVFYNPAQTPAASWVWNQLKVASIGDFTFAR